MYVCMYVCMYVRMYVCMYVCPSAWNNLVPTAWIFIKFDICGFFENCRGSSSLLKSYKNNGYST